MRQSFAISKFLWLNALVSAQGLALGSRAPAPSQGFVAYEIPEAQCADGSPYKIFIRAGNRKKLLLHFQGGGACWNFASCYGPVPFTRLKLEPSPDGEAITADQPDHPLADFTYVYVPYCTGDFYVGNHEASYAGRHVKHWGHVNLDLTLERLQETPHAALQKAETVFVYGESAGAIGAILNLDRIESKLASEAQRYLLSDAPGLHFNKNIWNRFSEPYLQNISQSMANNGLHLDRENGEIAVDMPKFCHHYSQWHIGILQGTEDLVMSAGFGNVTPAEHQKRVYGERGIYKAFENPQDKCASWTPKTQQHTFLTEAKSRAITSTDGLTPLDFLRELINPSMNEVRSRK